MRTCSPRELESASLLPPAHFVASLLASRLTSTLQYIPPPLSRMAAAVSTHRYPSSMASSHPTGLDTDDLLDLFAADTFSLESNRDRDLLLMASFLQGALPQSSSPPNGPSSSTGTAGAQWIGGNGPASSLASANSSAGWNGWRPDASTSSYGSYPSAPPAPSSSFAKDQAAFNANNNFGAAATMASGFGAPPPAPPTQTPHGTPMSFNHPSLPTISPELHPSRYGTRSNTRAQLQQQFAPPPPSSYFPTGCRAPAVSRERAPMGRRSSSLQGLPATYEAAGQPAEDGEDAGMDCDEDATMEEEESYSGRSGERYAFGNGWAGP